MNSFKQFVEDQQDWYDKFMKHGPSLKKPNIDADAARNAHMPNVSDPPFPARSLPKELDDLTVDPYIDDRERGRFPQRQPSFPKGRRPKHRKWGGVAKTSGQQEMYATLNRVVQPLFRDIKSLKNLVVNQVKGNSGLTRRLSSKRQPEKSHYMRSALTSFYQALSNSERMLTHSMKFVMELAGPTDHNFYNSVFDSEEDAVAAGDKTNRVVSRGLSDDKFHLSYESLDLDALLASRGVGVIPDDESEDELSTFRNQVAGDADTQDRGLDAVPRKYKKMLKRIVAGITSYEKHLQDWLNKEAGTTNWQKLYGDDEDGDEHVKVNAIHSSLSAVRQARENITRSGQALLGNINDMNPYNTARNTGYDDEADKIHQRMQQHFPGRPEPEEALPTNPGLKAYDVAGRSPVKDTKRDTSVGDFQNWLSDRDASRPLNPVQKYLYQRKVGVKNPSLRS
tara:strand:- start:5359 stop:6714 length:1356 start_codon:yes stop_codon:yes gene_type:complete